MLNTNATQGTAIHNQEKSENKELYADKHPRPWALHKNGEP